MQRFSTLLVLTYWVRYCRTRGRMGAVLCIIGCMGMPGLSCLKSRSSFVPIHQLWQSEMSPNTESFCELFPYWKSLPEKKYSCQSLRLTTEANLFAYSLTFWLHTDSFQGKLLSYTTYSSLMGHFHNHIYICVYIYTHTIFPSLENKVNQLK